MTSVRGGTVDAAAAMRTKIEKDGLLDTSTYEAWAKTLINAPVLIHSDVSAICEKSGRKWQYNYEK